MSDTTTVVAVPSDRTTNFDWGAIIGGALLASALSFVLLSFGAAAGVASVSPYSWNNPSGATLTALAAFYVSVVMIGSFLLGGYFAGRFRRAAGSASADEQEARDGAHGLLMWAVALLIGLSMAFLAASAATRGVASAVGGAVSSASQVAANPDVTSPFIDRMLRSSPGSANTDPSRANPRTEIARVISASSVRGEINNQDRDYVAGIVANEARIPQDEARKRVDATIEAAKEAANKARKIAGGLAFMIGALSILAAGAAFWAASAGGRAREKNLWR